MISIDNIERAAFEITSRAAIEIPQDYRDGLRGMLDGETAELSRFVLEAMLDNYEAAEQDRRAMCADTGVPRFFIKSGNEAVVEGGFVALEAALRREESRGAHFREDFPEKDPEAAKFNIVLRRQTDGSMGVERRPVPELPGELAQIIEENK